jgi:hypothetical protein
MTIQRLGVAAVFLVGCAVGGVSNQLAAVAVPKANAQQAASLTRWEYTCAPSPGENDLSRFGSEGWELTGVESHDQISNGQTTGQSSLYCFRRPKM